MNLHVNEQTSDSACVSCPIGKVTSSSDACGLASCQEPQTFAVTTVDEESGQSGGIAGVLSAVFVLFFAWWYYEHRKYIQSEKQKKAAAVLDEHMQDHDTRHSKTPDAPRLDADGRPIKGDVPSYVYTNDADEGIAQSTANPMVVKVDQVESVVTISPGEHWTLRRNEQGRKYWQNNVTNEKTYKDPAITHREAEEAAASHHDEL